MSNQLDPASPADAVLGLEDTMAAQDDDPRTQATLTDYQADTRRGDKDLALGELAVVDRSVYQVDGELARGGMGRIMRARDRRHGRVVALKESLHKQDGTLIARFTREAMITARLQHPAIVPVYEAGRWTGGDPFFAMKLVEGSSLAKEIAKRRTLAERMELLPNLLAVADALAYAHDRGVIHRDLKPSNVLIGSFGETVVIDWGLAKNVDDESEDDPLRGRASAAVGQDPDLTAAGHVIGTPVYMAPEQANGARVDRRADVYSLGAIAYHLLVGDAPYEGNSSSDVLERVLQGPPPPVRERACHVAPDLAAIVDKAMARDPAERYPCAKALAAELRRFHNGQLVSTHEYSMLDLVRRFLGRHRAAVAVAGVMLAAMIGLGSYAVSRIVAERNVARAERARAEKASAMATQMREHAERITASMVAAIDKRYEATGENLMSEDMAAQLLAYFDSPERASFHDLDAIEPAVRTVHFLAKKAHLEGDVELALRLYRRSLAAAEKLTALGAASRELVRIKAENHGRIASLAAASGDNRLARDEYRRAIQTFQTLVGPNGPDLELSAHLSQLYSQLGLLLFMDDDAEGSMAAYQQSQRYARALTQATATHATGASAGVRQNMMVVVDSERETRSGPTVGMRVETAAVDVVPGRAGAGAHGGKAPLVRVVSGDPAQLASLSEVPAPVGLMVSLENLDQQLQALGHAERSHELHDRFVRALEKHGEQFDDAAPITRAEVYLKLARKLARWDREKAADYAGQCVDILEHERARNGPAAELEARLEQARAKLRELQASNAAPAVTE